MLVSQTCMVLTSRPQAEPLEHLLNEPQVGGPHADAEAGEQAAPKQGSHCAGIACRHLQFRISLPVRRLSGVGS